MPEQYEVFSITGLATIVDTYLTSSVPDVAIRAPDKLRDGFWETLIVADCVLALVPVIFTVSPPLGVVLGDQSSKSGLDVEFDVGGCDATI